jgi:hypothetical protein
MIKKNLKATMAPSANPWLLTITPKDEKTVSPVIVNALARKTKTRRIRKNFILLNIEKKRSPVFLKKKRSIKK